MNRYELKELVAPIIEKEPGEIEDTALLAELGLTSIGFVSLIVDIEDKYFQAEKPVYKCLITDCDGVMWQGIAGEAGVDNARFDEASLAYCNCLHTLRQKGVLLAICSRNEASNIVSMLDSTETRLSISDFAIVQTGIANKAESVSEIANAFGFGTENLLFIDDSAYEIELVRMVLPDIHAIKYTSDTTGFLEAAFAGHMTTDIDRTEQYREQIQREKVHIQTYSAQEYNNILQTEIECRLAVETDVPRIVELSERTNRFNMTGRRYDATELQERLNGSSDSSVYILKAADKFGDMGLVGAALVCRDVIENFMISCRVFGRDFEVTLLNTIRRDIGDSLMGKYVSTGKNEYCKDFYASNCVQVGE